MEIVSLTLVGYRRLLLRNIETFTITPTSIYQIIIGTNGSGKSSVMRELSPLPPSSKDFVKGGSKTIELKHRGSFYKLVTDFSIGNGKHFFYKDDGENLNPGGTATVQKELIKQYFDYDDRIHRILMGMQRFSTIPAIQRREILMELSGADLDFAFKLWQTLKGLHRDQQGVVKHLSGRLAQETDKLLSPQEMETLEKRVKEFSDEIAYCMTEREPGLPNTQESLLTIKEILAKIHRTADLIFKTSLQQPGWIMPGEISNVEDIQKLTYSRMAKLGFQENALAEYNAEYDELVTIVEALASSNAQGVEELKQRCDRLIEERKVLLSKLTNSWDVGLTGIKDKFIQSMASYPQVVEVLTQLPANIDREFSRQNKEEVTEFLIKEKQSLIKLQEQAVRFNHQLDHIKTAQKQSCPKCGYVLGHNDGERGEAAITAELQNVMTKIDQARIEIEGAEEYLESYRQYATAYQRYASLVRDTPWLKVFWDLIQDKGLHFTSPMAAIPKLDNWIHDARILSEVAEMDEQRKQLREAISKVQSDGGTGFHERLLIVTEKIGDLTTETIETGKQINQLTTYQQQINKIMGYYGDIRNLAKELDIAVNTHIRALRSYHVDQVISADLGELATVQSRLNSLQAIQNVIRDLESSLEQADKDMCAFKLLVDEINPVDGLIADQLKGFIGLFVDQINGVIDQIWTYELNILPCGMDDSGLDYKFGLTVNGEQAGDDVRDSDASTGQLEVIDFAFKLVVMLYRNMSDYPLFLDELGPHMDVEHRNNIMRFVHSLVETKRCSQLWLVSHFSSMHEIFNNVEYCVMDERNIALPAVYNRHVTFT